VLVGILCGLGVDWGFESTVALVLRRWAITMEASLQTLSGVNYTAAQTFGPSAQSAE
jgi:hypothetical protein